MRVHCWMLLSRKQGNRGVRRIWVSSYDFQAPEMYEKAGFKRMAEFKDWPEGHINVVLCKILNDRMSVVGQSRHSDRGLATSGLPRTTDIIRASRHVSNVPTTDK
jgi:hypothetical protein